MVHNPRFNSQGMDSFVNCSLKLFWILKKAKAIIMISSF